MRKLLIILTILFSFFSISSNTFAESELDKKLEGSVTDLLGEYTPGKVVHEAGSVDGLKNLVLKLVTNISYILGVLAIGAIVYGGIMLATSAGEDEKVSKGKDIIKWAILGFIGLVSASGLIGITINIIYGLMGG